jgi:PAS domain S-box-containing protein
MATLIGVELFALSFTIHTLSSARALVGAEGLWSKAEKDATFSLVKYGYTHDELDYEHYLNMLAVPLGDHKARLAISKQPIDHNEAYEGFIQGRVYPDDINGMVNLLTRFHNNSYIAKAITYWVRGDSMISNLQNLGTKLHNQILFGKASIAEINQTTGEIQDLNKQVTVLEDNFSYSLGDGSRWMEHLILKLLFLIALTVELTGLFLTVSVSRAITKGISEIIRVAKKVATSDFTSRAVVFSKDEIGFLANSFNQMVGNLERKTIEEKQTENALRAQKELYETLLKTQSEMGEGVIISENGKIVYVNPATCKIYGYSMEEILRLSSFIKLIPKSEKHKLMENFEVDTVGKKSQLSGETKIQRKDGGLVDVEFTTRDIQTGGHEQTITVFRDVTEKNKVQEQLKKEKENAVRAELSKKVGEQFLATMSHEIRTPLNAIIGFTKIVLKTPLDAEQNKYLGAIKTSGDNLLVIINDILDFSRIKEGKMPIVLKNFSLSQVLSTCVEQMSPKAAEKKIKLTTIIDSSIPDYIIGDSARLTQVLLNFLSNAFKFTEKGEIRINVRRVSEEAEAIELEFSVKDSGIGIPENKLNSIFDAFTQANDDTSRIYGGTGLGLAIVKQLAELQRGSVSVESKSGEGSCFYFKIKYKKAKTQVPSFLKRPVNKVEEPEVTGLKVLVVEDNEMNQVLAQKVLEDWGWIVEIAENGKVAIDKVEHNNYDVVLMDIQMPEMNGYDATTYIREKIPVPKNYTPIIAMTAHALHSEEEKCFEAGMDDYISKPFNEKLLYTKIITVLNNRAKPLNIQFPY